VLQRLHQQKTQGFDIIVGFRADVVAEIVCNDTNDEHLRFVCDFRNYSFFLDDVSDELLTKDTEVLAHIVTNALENPHSHPRIVAEANPLKVYSTVQHCSLVARQVLIPALSASSLLQPIWHWVSDHERDSLVASL
jgi:hypothetical protein